MQSLSPEATQESPNRGKGQSYTTRHNNDVLRPRPGNQLGEEPG